MMGEAIFRALEGIFLGIFGLITVALVAAVVMFLFLTVCARWMIRFHPISIFAVSYLAALIISFAVARGNTFGGDYSDVENGFEITSLAWDFMGGSARLLLSALESFSKASRLLRLDLTQVTTIILWLWQKGSKAGTDDISAQFPELNTVRVLPQMRDIPGVIWLPDPRGIILLSGEFRAELAKAIKIRQRTVPTPDPVFESERQEPPPEPPTPSNEILEWYKTLGLPAYATVQQVKKKYRQLAKLHHPDAVAARTPEAKAAAVEKMTRINIAYENIMKSSG
jgi:hypothetical protein